MQLQALMSAGASCRCGLAHLRVGDAVASDQQRSLPKAGAANLMYSNGFAHSDEPLAQPITIYASTTPTSQAVLSRPAELRQQSPKESLRPYLAANTSATSVNTGTRCALHHSID
eukprot:56727-Eustigmatos_ZCMA.PRE.1